MQPHERTRRRGCGDAQGKLRAHPRRRFLFRLAELLGGRTVRELEQIITEHEVVEWEAELLLREEDRARWDAEQDMAAKTTQAMAQPRTAPRPTMPG